MVTEDNGSRFLRRVGKYLPNYELLILGDCRIREDPKSHSIQTPPPLFKKLTASNARVHLRSCKQLTAVSETAHVRS